MSVGFARGGLWVGGRGQPKPGWLHGSWVVYLSMPTLNRRFFFHNERSSGPDSRPQTLFLSSTLPNLL